MRAARVVLVPHVADRVQLCNHVPEAGELFLVQPQFRQFEQRLRAQAVILDGIERGQGAVLRVTADVVIRYHSPFSSPWPLTTSWKAVNASSGASSFLAKVRRARSDPWKGSFEKTARRMPAERDKERVLILKIEARVAVVVAAQIAMATIDIIVVVILELEVVVLDHEIVAVVRHPGNRRGERALDEAGVGIDERDGFGVDTRVRAARA
ncbi:hypothetical protein CAUPRSCDRAFT_11292 [Caulochytrium protostelioides]|uniref:Uncharacterized protein n=1 Tax=Caulochytrium protostelioides TaxID=1555241 RepID=A0A4P9WX03_9FUNG|nr:hypothetical protein CAUPRSCDRAFT_11292 [Caulochytrium protostelioides]